MKIEINPRSSDRCPHAALQRILIFMHPSVLSLQDQMLAGIHKCIPVAAASVIGKLDAHLCWRSFY